MNKPQTTHPRQCMLYLNNPNHRALLQPGVRLFGEFVRSTGTIFATPYRPPTPNPRIIGTVGRPASSRQRGAGLLTLLAKGESFAAVRFVNGRPTELPVEIVYETACYARTPFSPAEVQTLWHQTVTVLGCGTGGSKIAVELARAGVGHLKLCDPQRLEFANALRHEGDRFDVGKPKTQVVAEHVYRFNPAIQVETCFEDIFERDLAEIREILNADLVVAATDKTAKQLQTNELTRRFQRPCVFGGCYEEALGGEVFFTLPGEEMPCLACLRAGLEQPQPDAQIDYGRASTSGDYEGEPGLHAAIDFISCPQVQICLGILLRGVPGSKLGQLINPRRNFLLIGGALASGFYRFKRPFQIFFQPLKGPRSSCPVCGGLDQLLEEPTAHKEDANDHRLKRKGS
jgi:molybdopterin/thiamine biosynthesis adenylyltransferase